MLFNADLLFLEGKERDVADKKYYSVSCLDLGGIYRNFNFLGNVDDLYDLKQNDSCSAIFKLRFGKDKEAYIVKGVDLISIKKK